VGSAGWSCGLFGGGFGRLGVGVCVLQRCGVGFFGWLGAVGGVFVGARFGWGCVGVVVGLWRYGCVVVCRCG